MTICVKLGEKDKRWLAFGLIWEQLLGDSPKAEIAGSAKKLKAKRIVQVNSIDSVAGFDTDKSAKGQTYSAAASFALSLTPSIEHALLFYALPLELDADEAKVALIGIRDRVPAVGYDQIGTLSEMVDLGHAFVQSLDGRPVTTFFDGEFAPAQIEEFQPHEVKHIFSEDIQKEALLVSPPSTLGNLPVIAMLVFLVGGFAVGWHFWKEEQAKQARLNHKTAEPIMLYIQSRDQALMSDYRAPASQDIAVIDQGLRALPSAVGGWKIKEVNCTGRACVASWSSTSNTYDDFKSERGVGGALTYSIDGQSLTEMLPFPPSKPASLDITKLKTTQQVAELLAPWFQTLKIAGVNSTFRAPDLVGAWPGGMSPPPGTIEVIRRGTWQFMGPFDLVTEGVARLPEYMTVATVTLRIEADGDLKLTIGGSYYVKG